MLIWRKIHQQNVTFLIFQAVIQYFSWFCSIREKTQHYRVKLHDWTFLSFPGQQPSQSSAVRASRLLREEDGGPGRHPQPDEPLQPQQSRLHPRPRRSVSATSDRFLCKHQHRINQTYENSERLIDLQARTDFKSSIQSF